MKYETFYEIRQKETNILFFVAKSKNEANFYKNNADIKCGISPQALFVRKVNKRVKKWNL